MTDAMHPTDDALAAFVLAEDDEAVAEATSIHLLDCARCAGRVEELVRVEAILAELRAMAHAPILGRAEVEGLARRGLRLQHVRGDEEYDGIDPDADVVVMHVGVPRTDDPLTVILCALDGTPFRELAAERAAPDADEVLICCHRTVAQLSPGMRIRVEGRRSGRATPLADVAFVTGA